jgi:tRNA modification GTPase
MGVERAGRLIAMADVLLWLGEKAAPEHPHLIKVRSKSDLPGRDCAPPDALAVSALTGRGLSELADAIVREARQLLPVEGDLALNRRQSEAIAEAEAGLRSASVGDDVVLVAEMLRRARTAFDRLTGRAGVEDLLDSLFGRFCLGK